MRKILNEFQTREQAGLKKNSSTTDRLHTVNLLVEKKRGKNVPRSDFLHLTHLPLS